MEFWPLPCTKASIEFVAPFWDFFGVFSVAKIWPLSQWNLGDFDSILVMQVQSRVWSCTYFSIDP